MSARYMSEFFVDAVLKLRAEDAKYKCRQEFFENAYQEAAEKILPVGTELCYVFNDSQFTAKIIEHVPHTHQIKIVSEFGVTLLVPLINFPERIAILSLPVGKE